MRHVAAHIAAILLLGVMFVGSGTLLRKFTAIPRAVLGSAALASFTFGVSLWIGMLFILATLGWLRPTIVGPLAAVGLVIGIASVWPMRDRLDAGLIRRGSPDLSFNHIVENLGLVAPTLVLVAVVFLSLGPWIGADDGTYHLALPKIYLGHGGFRRLPFSVYSAWPLNIELLFAMAMMLQDYVLSKLVHAMFLVLLAIAVFRLASAHSSRAGGLLAVAFLLGNIVLLNEARFAYIDIGFAFFFFMAFVFALEYLTDGGRNSLLASGICCGIVAGTKLTGAMAVPCIALLILIGRRSSSGRYEPWANVRDVTAWVILPAFLLVLPWYVRSWFYTGNPVYPFLYEWFGGTNWSSDLERQFLDWQWSIGMGRAWIDYLLLPIRVGLEGGIGYEHFDGRINPIWLGLVPLCAAMWSDSLIRRALSTSAVYFSVWAVSSQQVRFLIPILPLLAVAAGVAASSAMDRLVTCLIGSHRRRRSLSPTLNTAVLVVIGAAFLWPARFVVRAGFAAAEGMARSAVELPGDAEPPVYRYISSELAPSARVLLLNTNHGFFLDRDYIADSFFEASQINALVLNQSDLPDLRQRLADLGVTHVLLSSDDWGIPYSPLVWSFLNDRRSVRLLYSSSDRRFRLFAINAAS